jgi:2-hydroxychromene-2-carboxylate isomerase
MHAPIECWFEFGSNYSYLSLMRIEALASSAGVPLRWKPFLLGPIFRELGYQSSPFNEQKEKGAYVWRDMARRAAKYGLAFTRPSVFPRQALLPMRVALLGAQQPWMGEFCRRIMLQNWVHDTDIDNAGVVLAALAGLVPDPAAIVEAAGQDDTKAALRAQTAEARRLGIFGAPTFMVKGEMFWGDDRLADALEFAQS